VIGLPRIDHAPPIPGPLLTRHPLLAYVDEVGIAEVRVAVGEGGLHRHGDQ